MGAAGVRVRRLDQPLIVLWAWKSGRDWTENGKDDVRTGVGRMQVLRLSVLFLTYITCEVGMSFSQAPTIILSYNTRPTAMVHI